MTEDVGDYLHVHYKRGHSRIQIDCDRLKGMTGADVLDTMRILDTIRKDLELMLENDRLET